MPVVIDEPEVWLEPASTLDHVKPLGPEAFEVRRVSRETNKASVKDMERIEEKS